ncbi:MAG: ABC transporter permease [Candidatus Promineifilaceae bacterium]|nr:ABC transporter permease [Candidatus Promineifilaceae bacterium]
MESLAFLALIPSLLAATWRMATPLIYASVGEVFTERTGVLNIGLEGIMLIGSFTAFAAVLYTDNLLIGIGATILVGIVAGLIFAIFTVTIKANQIVVGVAFNLLGLGMTGFLFRTLFVGTQNAVRTVPVLNIPAISDLPFLGEAFFRQNWMVYATLILIPLASFVLYKMAFGLSVRSVGEHPKAADTVGISVPHIRYMGVIIGATLTAIAGAYLTIAHTNQFVEGITSGRGFIALAVVVFGRWTPKGAFWASILFGFFFALGLRLQAVADLAIPYQAFQVLPYVATIVVLLTLRGRTHAPKALAVPYEP